jgi:hypothetical protein
MRTILQIAVVGMAVLISSCGNEKKDENKTDKDTTKTEKPKKEVKKDEAASMDKEFKADKNGQWAIAAEASSSYAGKATGKTASWSADQMIGAPDVDKYGDNGKAWASAEQDLGNEWVMLSYEKPVYATEVRIRMTYNPGAVARIELRDVNGKIIEVYNAKDTKKYNGKIAWFVTTFEKTKTLVKDVKITLDSKGVSGWNEIDAVQLVGTAE